MASRSSARGPVRAGAPREGDAGFEVAVVGAGVIGLAIAAAFARAGRSVMVLEQASGIARGVTSRNSEVIHAGLYYPTGSLKARLCVEGRRALYDWCGARRVAHRRLGKLIVATRPEEEDVLADLLAKGRANDVEGLAPIGTSALRALEPGVRATAALHSPETGIVDAHGLCLSLLAEAEAQGAVLALDRRVEALATTSFGWRLDVRGGDGGSEGLDVGLVVDAAGLEADGLAERAGVAVDALGWRQHPCKGDYFVLEGGPESTRIARGLPSRLVYPVPQQAGLGIHLTLDLAGRARFGPDAEYVDEIGFEVDGAKADRFRDAVARYLPAIAGARLSPDYAGIRPKLAGPGEGFRDFVVEECGAYGAPGFVACLGIESPGLTAALALAEYVLRWDSP
ncbi:MAG TPA: NAD(P)/FAD-dependent oxidoreductase [Myxococcota bacterium]|nr:NAD(P)/FAD-dependent oxidoreductase [Myxococcota bacterium]